MLDGQETPAQRSKEKGSAKLDSYQMERLRSFQQANPQESAEGIVFAGDSITEFFPLKKYLGREKPLINRGIAGTDSVWLLEHLQEQVLDLNPAKVFLMIGINDIGRGYALSAIAGRIADMIAQIRSQNIFTKIYLLSVLPVNEGDQYAAKVKIRNNAAVQQLNQALQVLAGAEYIDLYPLLLDDSGNLAEPNTIDGLHLSQEGYAKIAAVLKGEL
ncbi:SGNH/GDSL hydrolase family protein [Streptococcus caviae]|uniref:SGNH/GDSL hydrolase family protein n=1 Tax=Streptococcus sp. 'caviae' TaxID=1915004 RepID=UPI00094BBA96|nr:SGNH/GDSL hydrolase family protein [Streptococcus sp. 'caviae']OLN82646.1 lipase [Streptococcus sp. 'caviae']